MVPADPPCVPAVAGDAGQAPPAADSDVWAATKSFKLFVDVNALSWLVCFLKREFDAGFVPAVESAPAAAEVSGPWWDWRNECWVGRERPGHSGEKRPRQRKSVRSRMAPGKDLQHMAFDDAKNLCYDELCCALELEDAAAAVAAGPALADGEGAAAAAAPP
jgi:hypothetical protein